MDKQNSTKKKNKASFRFFIAIVVVLTIVCSIISYNYVIKSHTSTKEVSVYVDPDKGIRVDIPLGSSTTAIAKILKNNGIIKFPFIFKLMSNLNGYDGAYKSGTHIVSKDLDYDSLMRVLTSNPVSVKVTIPEGYTYKQIVDTLVGKKLINVDTFNNIANTEKFDSYDFLKGLPKRNTRLEGYLFPDTYEFDMKAGEKQIAERMLDRFNEIFRPEYYEKAKKLKMTTDKIIILASIIEGEAKDPDERKLISGVFYNRLNNKDKMLRKLQSCATIQYIYMNKQGVKKEKITEKDTKIDDPYNTYLYEGLPPGPICCPGKEAIEAALNPEKTDYIYFVAKGDGTHEFSKTYRDHQAATKKYGAN